MRANILLAAFVALSASVVTARPGLDVSAAAPAAGFLDARSADIVDIEERHWWSRSASKCSPKCGKNDKCIKFRYHDGHHCVQRCSAAKTHCNDDRKKCSAY